MQHVASTSADGTPYNLGSKRKSLGSGSDDEGPPGEKRPRSPEVDPCPICLDDIEDNDAIVTECFHRFHAHCILVSFQSDKKCPVCRRPMRNVAGIPSSQRGERGRGRANRGRGRWPETLSARKRTPLSSLTAFTSPFTAQMASTSRTAPPIRYPRSGILQTTTTSNRTTQPIRNTPPATFTTAGTSQPTTTATSTTQPIRTKTPAALPTAGTSQTTTTSNPTVANVPTIAGHVGVGTNQTAPGLTITMQQHDNSTRVTVSQGEQQQVAINLPPCCVS